MKKESEKYPFSCNQLSDEEARENLIQFLDQYGTTDVRIGIIAWAGSLPAFADGTPSPTPDGCPAPAPGNGAIVPARNNALDNWSDAMGIAAVAVACASAVFPPSAIAIIGCGFVMAAQILKHMK